MDTSETCYKERHSKIHAGAGIIIGARMTESPIGKGIPDWYLGINMATKFLARYMHKAYLFKNTYTIRLVVRARNVARPRTPG